MARPCLEMPAFTKWSLPQYTSQRGYICYQRLYIFCICLYIFASVKTAQYMHHRFFVLSDACETLFLSKIWLSKPPSLEQYKKHWLTYYRQGSSSSYGILWSTIYIWGWYCEAGICSDPTTTRWGKCWLTWWHRHVQPKFTSNKRIIRELLLDDEGLPANGGLGPPATHHDSLRH